MTAVNPTTDLDPIMQSEACRLEPEQVRQTCCGFHPKMRRGAMLGVEGYVTIVNYQPGSIGDHIEMGMLVVSMGAHKSSRRKKKIETVSSVLRRIISFLGWCKRV